MGGCGYGLPGLVSPEALAAVVAGGEGGDEVGGLFVDLGGVAEGEVAL